MLANRFVVDSCLGLVRMFHRFIHHFSVGDLLHTCHDVPQQWFLVDSRSSNAVVMPKHTIKQTQVGKAAIYRRKGVFWPR